MSVHVFFCDCGPIVRDLVDLDTLADDFSARDGYVVHRHATLCSDEGRSFMLEKLAAGSDQRVVVAACSPREHASDFAAVMREAGSSPYMLSRANIREQCAWVTDDKDAATSKASEMIAAAAERVLVQEPLEELEVDCLTDAMVVGSGVAGLTAAKLLAEGGRKVVLVERRHAIGGRIVLLGEAYPEMECASCMLEPLMDEVLHHPNVEVLTGAEVQDVVGSMGNFKVNIRKRARRVDAGACFACQTCSEACPAEAPEKDADEGLGSRKAVGIPYPGALPNASAVRTDVCVRASGEECDACAKACPFGAIDLEAEDEILERNVGALVIATGTEQHADDDLLGMPDVVTLAAFERMLNIDGPTGGEIVTADGSHPKSVVFLHCADSTGSSPRDDCTGVCCMSIAKCAHELARKVEGVSITQVGRDASASGAGFRAFAEKAAEGVRKIRLEQGDAACVTSGAGPIVEVLHPDGSSERIKADLVVVATPFGGATGADGLAGTLGIEVDALGFVVTEHARLRPFASRLEGVYVAGGAQAPRDIAGTASHAAAAAGAILSALVPGRKLQLEAACASVDAEKCGGCRLCVQTCPYKAVSWSDEQQAAVVEPLLCRGCGSCAAGCPASAIVARHFTDEQLRAEIVSFCSERPTA